MGGLDEARLEPGHRVVAGLAPGWLEDVYNDEDGKVCSGADSAPDGLPEHGGLGGEPALALHRLLAATEELLHLPRLLLDGRLPGLQLQLLPLLTLLPPLRDSPGPGGGGEGKRTEEYLF